MPNQAELPMDMPVVEPVDAGAPVVSEEAMRRVFFRWSRWHRAKSYEAAVADPLTARLLALTVRHEAVHRLPDGRGRR